MSTSTSQPDFADLSTRTGLSVAALRVLWEALCRGHGRQAQFDHAELGGMGQWMAGGMTMIGDMFNTALAAKVAAACALLAELGPGQAEPAPGWWPAALGVPDASAGQERIEYALFRAAGRLAVRAAGVVTVYDVSGIEVLGIGMQDGSLVVQTTAGPRPLDSFRQADASQG
jgi:hypothetical protein